MKNIITKAEMSTLAKQANGNDADIDRCIVEAEVHDIIPTIGASLYNAIGESQETYAEILNGCTFTDKNGRSRLFLGLKRATAYYAESRFIRSANVQITKFGAVVKQDEYSDNSNQSKLNQESNYLKSCADEIMEIAKAYLAVKKTDTLYAGYYAAPTNSGKIEYMKVKIIGE